MIRRTGIAAIGLLLLLLAGPLGLLALDHGHLHAEAGASAAHQGCPICLAAKQPAAAAAPSVPLPDPVPEAVLPAPRPEARETAPLLPTSLPRGPPSSS